MQTVDCLAWFFLVKNEPSRHTLVSVEYLNM